MKICYVEKNFAASSMAIIDKANEILEEYAEQGFTLTLRQLYYQFVARALIANKQSEYKRLGSIVNDARLAGIMDWEFITDRTRSLNSPTFWNSPKSIVEACAEQYDIDMWEHQDVRPEVWVEKDALIDVVGQGCNPYNVPHFSCRGYTSQSSIFEAAERITDHLQGGYGVTIFHLGDHDPSGIDMTRDIIARLRLMVEGNLLQEGCDFADVEPFKVHRIALTRQQIDEQKPPPNPAKVTDSRFEAYREKHGGDSWELDALEPSYIVNLIDGEIQDLIDGKKWIDAEKKRDEGRGRIAEVADTLRSIA